MTDPVTNNYSLVLPTVGGDSGTWGGIQNNGVFTPIDAILGANFAVTVTSSDVTLTATQFQNAIFVVSGVLTGNHNLIVPLSPNSLTVACGGKFIVVNNTTGSFNLSVITAASGSTGVSIPQGFATSLYSDGTNVVRASDGQRGFAAASNGNPNGQLAGTAGSINTPAQLAFDFINGIFYVCTTTGTSSTAVWSLPQVIVARGFDTAVNLSIAVTHTGGNLLNVAFNQANGSAATSTTPIIVPFQSTSGSTITGLPNYVNVTGALSMTTFATGATFGTSSNTPFRLWFALFNSSGTVVPAIANFSTAAGNIYPTAEYGITNTLSISGSATNPGTWYTPNGTTLTACPFRLVGYCEWLPGNLLATAGTYTSNPSNGVLFGPGIKKPGDLVQRTLSVSSTGTSITGSVSSKTATATSVTFAPSSTVNQIYVRASGTMFSGGSGSVYNFQLARNSSSNLFGSVAGVGWWNGGGTQVAVPVMIEGVDQPQTTSIVTYTLYGWIAGAGSSAPWSGSSGGSPGGTATSVIVVEEMMG